MNQQEIFKQIKISTSNQLAEALPQQSLNSKGSETFIHETNKPARHAAFELSRALTL
jgi:hypothetical protein